MIPEGLNYSFSATIVLNSSIEPDIAIRDVIAQVTAVGIPVAAVFAGAETGMHALRNRGEIFVLLHSLLY